MAKQTKISTDHTPHRHNDRTDPNAFFTLSVPIDVIRSLRPAARLHQSSVAQLVLDLLLVLAREPELTGAIFDEN